MTCGCFRGEEKVIREKVGKVWGREVSGHLCDWWNGLLVCDGLEEEVSRKWDHYFEKSGWKTRPGSSEKGASVS